jgi:aspartyl-tRNA(Asn)/glutamyl-tRNA(Gln) amidotransferase subunit B
VSVLPDGYEMVVGLEVHTELLTRTKLFCGCPNRFGAEPNTLTCPVCLGLPGSLPVLNERAVELAMAIGFALDCTVAPSTFHRKNYFYPDMPKDYQISQYDLPINVDGRVTLDDGSVVTIVRAHIEEDTGKTTHLGATGRIHGAARSLVDYNRSGVPLVEIVSGPDISGPEQARAYVSELRGILVATGASDGRMEEGSLRIDANVSVRQPGAALGTRCEIKNLNSLRSLQRAIEYEARRQVDLLRDGGTVRQETRHWNEDAGQTTTMRSKEEADDYRYFLEPDLVEVAPDAAWRDRVRASLPALPAERRRALLGALGEASPAQRDAIVVVVELGLDEYVVGAIGLGADAATALSRAANELASASDSPSRLTIDAFAATVLMEQAREVTATQSKAILAELIERGGDPRTVAAERGFQSLSGNELTRTIDELLAEHHDEWRRYLDGDDKLASFFVGQVMKATRGQADGQAVTDELSRRRQAGG